MGGNQVTLERSGRPLVEAQCDQCDGVFVPEFTERRLRDGGLRIEFRCPHCRHLYPVYQLTARGVELREQVWAMREIVDAGGTVDPRLWQRTMDAYHAEFTELSGRRGRPGKLRQERKRRK